jgi:hypothetical protein
VGGVEGGGNIGAHDYIDDGLQNSHDASCKISCQYR